MSNTPCSPIGADGICAVTVTYQPDSLSFDCLQAIFGTAAHTIVVDNHSQPAARDRLRMLAGPKVTLIENAENLGIATALNQGIAAAAQAGFSWFLLFDQDTLLTPGYFAAMAAIMNEARAELGPGLGFLGSNYFLRMADGTVTPGIVAYSPERRWAKRRLVITSGTLISLDRFRDIGPFKDDYFIGYVDTEYCLRAQQKGFTVASTVAPLIVQRLGLRTYRRAWLGLGRKRAVEMYSPLRRYYDARNLQCVEREFARDFPDLVRELMSKHRQMNRAALLREGHPASNLFALWTAWRHARRGCTGKYRGRFLQSG